MQSLLRTRPENIDDLTVQVALVRPGPIQGKAVHPYIEHRQRLREDPSFVPPVDHPLLADCLRSTLGVVVFQDQVLEVAIALAGFSVGEAEGLRRAMSRKRSHDALEAYRERFVEGALQQRRRRADGRHGLRQARRLLRLRLPEVACGGVRAARVPVGVAAAPLSGRVPVLAPERAADGLLSARDARPRRPAARSRDAPAGRERQRRQVRASRTVRCASASTTSTESAKTMRRLSSPSANGAARSPSVRDLAQRTQLSEHGLETLIVAGACDCFETAAAPAALAARPRAALADRSRLGWRGEAARAAARSDGGDARAAGADRLGAHARRLPHDEPVRRRPSAGAAACASAGRA